MLEVAIGKYTLESGQIVSYEFYNGIEFLLPSGTLEVLDPNNELIGNNVLNIGSPVRIFNEDNNLDVTLYIKSIERNPYPDFDKFSKSEMGGVITLYLTHILYFTNIDTRGYREYNHSKLIKNLVQYDNSLKVKSSSDSDDLSLNRYQLDEKYYEFLENRILPYTTINNEPAYVYIDLDNTLHLDTYNSMIDYTSNNILVHNKGSYFGEERVYTFFDGFWKLGGSIDEVYSRIFPEDLIFSNSDFTVTEKSNFKSSLPINNNVFDKLTKTGSSKHCENIPESDAQGYKINLDKALDKFVSLSLICLPTYDFNPGDVINLYLGSDMEVQENLDGKYLISQVRQRYETGVVFTELVLIRRNNEKYIF